MDIKPETPWDGTPDVSARIITAISRIASVMRSGVWEFATSENLNPAQVDILQLLHARPKGVRLSWVAAQLSISAASASDSVASLVSKGLVRKARAEDDGRATALFLTAAGTAVAVRIGSAVSFADDAAAALPPALQVQMLTGLLKLIAELQTSERFPALRACPSCRHFEANKYPGAATPHHCALVNAPLPIAFIRIDCAEHEEADLATQQRNWAQFA
ncbi:MarR family transcriptional regulator [Pseudoduganella aquatica]|uniref:MarR family transcriptional regulator n=1 Tax=Pseudoduganella aquatica TaxID=2660641 RepID=A0A7X4HI32_9BURK|nr:MarR family transcriptional regulator [Pseudoduganella aquatica]MYN10942.1 MarR family transcriptional regulator [Pseudoduganella aquatica]